MYWVGSPFLVPSIPAENISGNQSNSEVTADGHCTLRGSAYVLAARFCRGIGNRIGQRWLLGRGERRKYEGGGESFSPTKRVFGLILIPLPDSCHFSATGG